MDSQIYNFGVFQTSLSRSLEEVVRDRTTDHPLVSVGHVPGCFHCDSGRVPALFQLLASGTRSRSSLSARLCAIIDHGRRRHYHRSCSGLFPHSDCDHVQYAAQTVRSRSLDLSIFLIYLMPCRKISLVLLFALSLILVAVTLYRVYGTIERHSNQQFRSLLASIEILAAAAVSNALVLGSFVRDRGVKKQKFKFGSTGGNSILDRPTTASNRPRAALSWGSDSDLVGDLGIRLGPEFSDHERTAARPAPTVSPLHSPDRLISPIQTNWTYPKRHSTDSDETDLKITRISREDPPSPRDVSVLTPRRMSFFDVGGLLGDEAPRRTSSLATSAPSSTTFSLRPLINHPPARHRSPRGARTLLEDVGGLLHHSSRTKSAFSSPISEDDHF